VPSPALLEDNKHMARAFLHFALARHFILPSRWFKLKPEKKGLVSEERLGAKEAFEQGRAEIAPTNRATPLR
jgi:hypothetical protein